jgi:hypothetical protein
MKKSTLLLKLLLPLVLMAVMASGVAATAEFIYRDGYEALCSEGLPERFWESGDKYQIRGQLNLYRTYSPDSDKHTGTNYAIINATLDPNTGNGTARGTFKSIPDIYSDPTSDSYSYWEGTFSGRLIDGLYTGSGVGFGTGELSGMQMKTVTREFPFDESLMPPDPCSTGTNPPTMLHNEIRVLIPHGG